MGRGTGAETSPPAPKSGERGDGRREMITPHRPDIDTDRRNLSAMRRPLHPAPQKRCDCRRERLSALCDFISCLRHKRRTIRATMSSTVLRLTGFLAPCGFISCQRHKGETNGARMSSTVYRLTSHRLHLPSHVYPLTGFGSASGLFHMFSTDFSHWWWNSVDCFI